MKVKTAVIFASGFGSRMLPITSAVQKELLPILDRPVIDYVVADCVAAGIKRIIFVIRPGTHALQDYYLGLSSLQHHLQRFGKKEALATLKRVHKQASFEFIEQPEDAGYGSAVPLRVARASLPDNEAVVVCCGDDFLYHADGTSEVASMIQTFNRTNAVGVISGLEQPDDQLHKYGVIETRAAGDNQFLAGFVEKPAPGTAPSSLANISKYIFTPTVLDYVDALTTDEKSGEYYLTDAVLACAKEHDLAVHEAGGRYLDAGTMTGWLEANLALAQSRPDLVQVMNDAHHRANS